MRDSLTVEIVRVRQENPEVTTLYFARPFDFMAGQYITVSPLAGGDTLDTSGYLL